uniref:SH2 domain-containing protein n=1 Tax=Calidris pygmaea TaxID=425635 RepID=A0A8C3KJC1_9CHAR
MSPPKSPSHHPIDPWGLHPSWWPPIASFILVAPPSPHFPPQNRPPGGWHFGGGGWGVSQAPHNSQNPPGSPAPWIGGRPSRSWPHGATGPSWCGNGPRTGGSSPSASSRFRGEVKHIKVLTAEGLYRVTEKKVFKGLVELVEFYQRSSLKDCFKALDTALEVPFKEPHSGDGARPPGSLRTFGAAKARYDFCARDRRELSLRQGDVVRVLSKKGHPGFYPKYLIFAEFSSFI